MKEKKSAALHSKQAQQLEMVQKIERSKEQAKNGKATKVKGVDQLNAFLDNL